MSKLTLYFKDGSIARELIVHDIIPFSHTGLTEVIVERSEILCEQRDKERPLIEILLLSFVIPLKYDYTMPDGYTVNRMVMKAIETLDLPNHIKETLKDLTRAGRDEYSKLEDHIRNNNSVFENEWLCGLGTLYRWRAGERQKAINNTKQIPVDDLKYYEKIQDYLKFNAEKCKDF